MNITKNCSTFGPKLSILCLSTSISKKIKELICLQTQIINDIDDLIMSHKSDSSK